MLCFLQCAAEGTLRRLLLRRNLFHFMSCIEARGRHTQGPSAESVRACLGLSLDAAAARLGCRPSALIRACRCVFRVLLGFLTGNGHRVCFIRACRCVYRVLLGYSTGIASILLPHAFCWHWCALNGCFHRSDKSSRRCGSSPQLFCPDSAMTTMISSLTPWPPLPRRHGVL